MAAMAKMCVCVCVCVVFVFVFMFNLVCVFVFVFSIVCVFVFVFVLCLCLLQNQRPCPRARTRPVPCARTRPVRPQPPARGCSVGPPRRGHTGKQFKRERNQYLFSFIRYNYNKNDVKIFRVDPSTSQLFPLLILLYYSLLSVPSNCQSNPSSFDSFLCTAS